MPNLVETRTRRPRSLVSTFTFLRHPLGTPSRGLLSFIILDRDGLSFDPVKTNYFPPLRTNISLFSLPPDFR
jgi:hypothetical protein